MTPNEIKNKMIEACPDIVFHKHLGYRDEIVIEVELHHVLRAIEKAGLNGSVRIYSDGSVFSGSSCIGIWNLSKDFDGQEDSVKEFIGELLK